MAKQKNKCAIPEISDEQLEDLYLRIKPVVRFDTSVNDGKIEPLKIYAEGMPFYIKDVDPRTVAFTWDPKPVNPAKDIERLDDIVTYHSFGAPVFFKPSIAEVLTQIPRKYLEKTVAFEVRTKDLGNWNVVTKDGNSYHVVMTRLYQKRKTGGEEK
jgi:hypothetical protein